MKKIEEIIKKLNSQQKLIFAIGLPVGLFILFMPVAYAADDNGVYSKLFNFKDTWWVWLIYVCIVGLIEYKLFENKQ
jgi:hypothetical protein